MLKSRSSLNELERNSGTVYGNTRQRSVSFKREQYGLCIACSRPGLSRVARVHATREIETLFLSLSLRSTASSPRRCYGSLVQQERRRGFRSGVEGGFLPFSDFFVGRTMDVASLKVFITRNYARPRSMGKYFVYDDPVKDSSSGLENGFDSFQIFWIFLFLLFSFEE